jgi:hypothetical protein
MMATTRNIVEGLEILARACPDGNNAHLGGAEHDKIWGPPANPSFISEEDRRRLDLLGWSYDEQYDGWYHFV